MLHEVLSIATPSKKGRNASRSMQRAAAYTCAHNEVHVANTCYSGLRRALSCLLIATLINRNYTFFDW